MTNLGKAGHTNELIYKSLKGQGQVSRTVSFPVGLQHRSQMRKILYSYFMVTRRTVKLLSRDNGGDLGNCCQRPRATVSKIFSPTEGPWFDCSPSSLEITV